MNFFKKVSLAVLSFSAACSFLTAGGGKCTGIDRIICTQQERLATTPFNPLDPDHAGMLSLNSDYTPIFNESDVEIMVQEAIVRFRDAYGIDFDENTNPNVTVLTGGIRVIAGLAQMIPYINNAPEENYYVTVDTCNPDRVNKWIQVSVGQLVVFSATGTIPNDPLVPNSGAQYKPLNNWFYGYNLLVKKGKDWSKKKNKETITSTSYQLGLLTPNQWNAQDILVTLSSADEDENQGLCLAPTAGLRIPQGSTGTPYSENVNYFVWKKTCP